MIKNKITKIQFDILCDLLDVALDTNDWCRARSKEERKDMEFLYSLKLVRRLDATKGTGEKESFWICSQKGAAYIVKHWAKYYPNEAPEYSFNGKIDVVDAKEKEEIPQLKLVVS
jgi:hypothetical protein